MKRRVATLSLQGLQPDVYPTFRPLPSRCLPHPARQEREGATSSLSSVYLTLDFLPCSLLALFLGFRPGLRLSSPCGTIGSKPTRLET